MEQPAPQSNLIGATVGNYKVVSKLGEGGMGSVYLAEHPLIGKKVALKVLHAEFASNDEVVSRFFTEARSVNNIQHPNIVDIVDYGVIPGARPTEAGMVYFIMEFLDGESLSSVIHREAPLPPERALKICLQVADALSASHAQRIVHRDLKPDNIMLVTRGRDRDFIKVLDFGIAKLTGDQPGSRRTRTGIVMGTPAYMSPEQCEGRGDIDHRTDVYALGIVLYEALTGRVPFVGNGYGEVLVQHLTQKPARPSTIRGVIPPHVEMVVMKALEKNPGHRFPNMDEFLKALQDPVGFVESHGGLAGFLAPDSLMGGQGGGGVDSSRRATVAMTDGMHASMLAGIAPATATPKPTTLSGGTGQMQAQMAPSRSKMPVIAAVVVGLLAVGGIGIYAMSGGSAAPKAATPGVTAAPAKPAGGEVVKPSGGEVKPAGGEVVKPAGGEVVKPSGGEVKPPVAGGTPEVKPAGGQDSATPEVKPAGGEIPPPPVKPAQVTVKVESTPPGADVYVGNETTPRGKTPFEVKIDVGKNDVPITLKRDGYEDIKKMVAPDHNETLRLEMKAKPAEVTPPTTPRTPGRTPGRRPTRKPTDTDILKPELN